MSVSLCALPLSSRNLDAAAAFLKKRESVCVSLAGSLLNEGKIGIPSDSSKRFWLVCPEGGPVTDSDICSVFMVAATGLMRHATDTEHALLEKGTGLFAEQLKQSFRSVLKDTFLYCLMGEKKGTDLIRPLYDGSVSTCIGYDLLEYAAPDNTREETLARPLRIRQLLPGDEDAVFPLQKAYEIEEVVPPGESFNEDVCRAGLRRALRTQLVFAVWDGDVPVAKAGTNARGFGFDQIGGVYTIPRWRGKGLARAIVNHTARRCTAENRRVVLFVKKQNIPAQRAYTHAGFVFRTEYEIVYYRPQI